MNVEETREVRHLLKGLVVTDLQCKALAMQAATALGGYPVDAEEIRTAWRRADETLEAAAGQGTVSGQLGRTASAMSFFNKSEGSPKDLSGFFAAAADACKTELPLWLIFEGRRRIAQSAQQKVDRRGGRLNASDPEMLFKAESSAQAELTAAKVQALDSLGAWTAGSAMHKQHGANVTAAQQTAAQRDRSAEVARLRKLADATSDPALRNGYEQRASDLERHTSL